MNKTIMFTLTLGSLVAVNSIGARPGNDPFAELFGSNSIFSEMFGGPQRGSLMIAMPNMSGRGATGGINTDTYARGNVFYIKADVPGAEKSDIKVSIDHNRGVLCLQVTTSDTHKQEQHADREGGYFEMRSWSSSSQMHSREFPLPDNYDRSKKIQSSLKNGVLTIEVPLENPIEHKQDHIEEIEVEVTS